MSTSHSGYTPQARAYVCAVGSYSIQNVDVQRKKAFKKSRHPHPAPTPRPNTRPRYASTPTHITTHPHPVCLWASFSTPLPSSPQKSTRMFAKGPNPVRRVSHRGSVRTLALQKVRLQYLCNQELKDPIPWNKNRVQPSHPKAPPRTWLGGSFKEGGIRRPLHEKKQELSWTYVHGQAIIATKGHRSIRERPKAVA